MHKQNLIKVWVFWFFVLVDFAVVFLSKEEAFACILLVLLGACYTWLFQLKEKDSLSADMRKALRFALDVGFYFFVLGSIKLLIETVLEVF